MFVVNTSWTPSGSAVADAISRALAEGKNPKGLEKFFERATNSAISGESYVIMKAIKKAIKENTFGWDAKQRYTPTGDIMQAVRRKAGNLQGKQLRRPRPTYSTPGPFYGQIGKLFFYQLDKKAHSAKIGIIPGFKRTGKSAETAAIWLSTGGRDSVTPKMRGFFGALGIPFKASTAQIITPPRPLVGKVLDEQQGSIKDRLEKRFIDRLLSY